MIINWICLVLLIKQREQFSKIAWVSGSVQICLICLGGKKLERPATPSVQLLSGRSRRSHSGCTERPPARGESVQEFKQCYSVFLSAVLLSVELR